MSMTNGTTGRLRVRWWGRLCRGPLENRGQDGGTGRGPLAVWLDAAARDLGNPDSFRECVCVCVESLSMLYATQ